MRQENIRRITLRSSALLHFPVTAIPEFWNDMVRGSAPLMMMKKAMGETVWREKEKLALDYLKERLPSLGRLPFLFILLLIALNLSENAPNGVRSIDLR